MVKKPIIHIVIEIKARELEGKTLLALEAAHRGFRVLLGHKDDVNKGLKMGFLPPGVHYEKSLTRGKEEKLAWKKKMGCALVSQDEEAGLRYESYQHFVSYRATTDNLDMVDALFCWGKDEHEAWAANYPLFASRLFITGSPRSDFWRPDFQGYFKNYVDKVQTRYGRTILLVSNFHQANSFKTVEERIAQNKKTGSIRTQGDEDNFLKKIQDIKLLYRHFTELICLLADTFPDTNFIVRPHPVEDISGWKNSLGEKKNIHIIFQGGISPWVRSSSAIIHNGCTTGIEAYASKVPAIAYTPFSSFVNWEIPNRLSINCATQEEVSRVLSRIINNENVNEHRTSENDELINNRLANITGDTAAKRIIDVLEKMDVPESPPIKPGIAGFKMTLKNEYNRFINKFRNKETRITRKFSGLKLSELKEIQDNLAMVTDKYRDCRIRRLFGDVFVVEKD